MSLFDVTDPTLHTDARHVLTFTARGIPKPQGSKRAFVARTGRAVMTESGGAAHKDWRATVAHAALEAMGDQALLDGPLRVAITFALPRPKSHPKTRRTWPIARPDIDKLTRAVLDSCTATVWRDDSQVTDLHVSKVWAELDIPHGPGADITISTLQEQPA